MLHSMRRISATALCIAFSLTGVASAAETEATPPQGKSLENAQSYYTERYKVEPADAKRRLELQSRVKNLDAKLHAELRDGFSQSYFDNEDGLWVVALSPTGDESAARSFLRDLGLSDAEVRISRAEFNASELRQTNAELRKRLVGSEVAFAVHARKIDAYVPENVASDDRSALDTLSKGSKVPIEIHEVGRIRAETTAKCSFNPYVYESVVNANVPTAGCDIITAGQRIYPNGGYCTAGFNVKSSTDTRPFVLTAGHCAGNGQGGYWDARYWSGERFRAGNWMAGFFSRTSQADSGLMRLDTCCWGILPHWVNWWNETWFTRATGWSDVGYGTAVCKQGARTGTTCGTALSGNGYTYCPSTGDYCVSGMMDVRDMHVDSGDSGAPVQVRDSSLAAGTVSGHVYHGSTETTIVEPIRRSLSLFKVTLAT